MWEWSLKINIIDLIFCDQQFSGHFDFITERQNTFKLFWNNTLEYFVQKCHYMYVIFLSPQGVTLEDIQKAEEVLSSAKTDAERKEAALSEKKETVPSAVSDRLRDSGSSVPSKDSDSSVYSGRTSIASDSAKRESVSSEDTSSVLLRRDHDTDRKDVSRI